VHGLWLGATVFAYDLFIVSERHSKRRHLLPASALARVFFPTKEELVQYFGAESLPEGLPHLPLLVVYLTGFLIRIWWLTTTTQQDP
jgi:hypothetical protein